MRFRLWFPVALLILTCTSLAWALTPSHILAMPPMPKKLLRLPRLEPTFVDCTWLPDGKPEECADDRLYNVLEAVKVPTTRGLNVRPVCSPDEENCITYDEAGHICTWPGKFKSSCVVYATVVEGRWRYFRVKH
jgi:hypothetical protein